MLKILIKYKRIIKYLFAGGTAALVDFALLYFFTGILGIWYLISSCLAFIAGFFVSFFLQKFWTFRDADKNLMYRQMTVYLGVALLNLGLNASIMYLLVDGLKIWYMLAQFISSGLIACESYLVYKIFIFNRTAEQTEKSGAADATGLKILIATGVYPPDIGGPATYAFNLARELVKAGNEIKILAYGEKRDGEEVTRVSRSQNMLGRYLSFFLATYRLGEWAGLIYVLDLMSAGLPAVLAAKLKGKKIIFRTGGDFLWEKAYQSGWTDLPLAEYYKQKKNLKEKILLRLCRWTLKQMDLVIFSTELQAKIYRDHYGLPESKTKLVPNALPDARPSRPDERYGDAVIFAGRLIKLKNLERLIRAFGRINDVKTKLLLFGDGPEKDRLEKLINSQSLAGRVKLAGQASQQELINNIAGCKFFILPSLSEISPNLALECLSFKKPLILTKETGLPENLTAKLITVNPLDENDLKDKMEYLLKEENLVAYQKSLNDLALARWGWPEVAGAHLEIFKALS